MTAPITITRTTSRRLWDDYVSRADGATLYHLYDWRRVVQDTFGHDAVYLSALGPSGEVLGVLPLVRLHSWAFGNMLVSLPFFNYGGICGEGEAPRAMLLQEAIRVGEEIDADFIEIRHQEDWPGGLAKKTSKVSMRLDLPESADALWKAFPAKLRNQIQKPRKEGLTTAVGRDDQLDAFYDVFSANMRDLGTPVYAKAFFRNILDTFPERTWITTVYYGKTPVASGFLAGFRDRLEIPWASSIRAFNRLGPNMLLYWTCLETACERGYRIFDFGRSTPGEGTYRFKEQWGARPHPLYWHYWLPSGRQMPQVNPKNPKYRAAIAVWQRLPLSVTRRLGPRIVKYIP